MFSVRRGICVLVSRCLKVNVASDARTFRGKDGMCVSCVCVCDDCKDECSQREMVLQ